MEKGHIKIVKPDNLNNGNAGIPLRKEVIKGRRYKVIIDTKIQANVEPIIP